MRRLAIGIASYENPEKLEQCLFQLMHMTELQDVKIFIIDNNSQDPAVLPIIDRFCNLDSRFTAIYHHENTGYVGVINHLFQLAQAEYIAYCDNDAYVMTKGWDGIMSSILDVHHEIGMLFAGGGPYAIPHADYTEILWGVGCFWMLPSRVAGDVGLFDAHIGHHEEVDYQTRVRLQGLLIGACPQVSVIHHASASTNPTQHERISKGVMKWVTKWNRYFCGAHQHYGSTNVLRHEDWPPSALYLERYWQQVQPHLNENPETLVHNGQEYDLIKVPRLKGFYRGRII